MKHEFIFTYHSLNAYKSTMNILPVKMNKMIEEIEKKTIYIGLVSKRD
jgi:hypothetical protein